MNEGELTSAALQRRRLGDTGRLVVELRVLGLLGLMWLAGIVQALAWAWATVGLPEPMTEIPWLQVLAPHLVAANVVGAAIVIDMPAVRWPQFGSLGTSGPVWPWLIAAAPLAPVALALRARDRRARTKGEHNSEQIEQAFHQLLQFPRQLGLRFLAWSALAAVISAIVLGTRAGWPREVIVGFSLLSIALLGPLAAILSGWSRAMVRPEYLTAPRPTRGFRRSGDLWVRLVFSASIAGLGAVAAPLCAGYLIGAKERQLDPIAHAQGLANELAGLGGRQASEELGRLLGEHPQAVVQVGHRTFGQTRLAIPDFDGLLDTNADDYPDLAVAHSGEAAAVVPIGPPPPPVGWLLVATAGVCVLGLVWAVGFVATDLRRDVRRATAQVRAVAQGDAPQPLTEGSFSSLELRQLVVSVDRLVARITEANVSKYVAIEKAKEADRLKSQFLANMSHDLRSPLNSILGFSELLLSGIDGDLTSEQRAMVEPIYENGRSLLQQIDDILDTAKIDAMRLDLHPEPTPPATLVNRSIHNAKKRQRGVIDYDVDVAAGLPPAFVDPYRTVQAIENVLLFASERIERGTVRVKVRLGKTDRGRMIFVQIHTPERPATAEQLAQARRGFYRIPGHPGLGLGLPIAGSILELEGGALGIEDLGDAMIFSIQLCAPEARRGVRLREVQETA